LFIAQNFAVWPEPPAFFSCLARIARALSRRSPPFSGVKKFPPFFFCGQASGGVFPEFFLFSLFLESSKNNTSSSGWPFSLLCDILWSPVITSSVRWYRLEILNLVCLQLPLPPAHPHPLDRLRLDDTSILSILFFAEPCERQVPIGTTSVALTFFS